MRIDCRIALCDGYLKSKTMRDLAESAAKRVLAAVAARKEF
jgi:hypothetical protein